MTGKGTALKPIFDLLNLWHEKYHA
ncbi:hypothetical protein [Lactococcus hircilactis]|nr:hypothetical protein [Lactococcus hircilactis]